MLIDPKPVGKTNRVEFQSEGQKLNYDAHLLLLSLVGGALTKRECSLRRKLAGANRYREAGNGR